MAIANGQQEKEGISQDNQLAAMAVVLVTFQQGHNSDFNSLFSEKRRTINQLATATKTAEALAMATTH